MNQKLIIGTNIENILPDSLNDEFFRKSQINVKSLLNFDQDCIPNEPVVEDILLQIIETAKVKMKNLKVLKKIILKNRIFRQKISFLLSKMHESY